MQDPLPEGETLPEEESSQYLKELGKRLRSARGKAGLSAAEAGKKSKMSANTILRYERGLTGPGPQKIHALADTYGVCLNWLHGRLDWNGEPEDGKAVADLDKIEAVENAKTEDDIAHLILWKPAPIMAVVSIPVRRRIVSGEEALSIGSWLFERILTVAPKAHRRWAAQHIKGG